MLKKKRVIGRPFRPGQSGNPGGRAKSKDNFTELARSHAPEALRRLMYWVRSDKHPVASVRAAIAICERAYGKPEAADAMPSPLLKGEVRKAIEVVFVRPPNTRTMISRLTS